MTGHRGEPYAEYRDSTHRWLGRVPAHWATLPFRRAFEESVETNGSEPVGVMLSVSGYRGVEVKRYEADSQMRSVEMLENYRVVRPGQLAVNTMWLNYAGLGVSEHLGYVSPAYRAYWIRATVEPRYIHHLMRSQAYVKGYTGHLRGIRPNSLQMDRDTLMNWPILIPPLDEQRAIADYLDVQTAKIDALIGKQETLIETLRERRAAVVEATLIELDWTTPLRSTALLIQTGPFGSQLKADEYVTGGVAVINPSHMVDGSVAPDPAITVSETKAAELARHSLREGDLVVARRGELGRCAVVDRSSAGGLCGTGSALVRPKADRMQGRFLAQIFQSRATRDALSLASVGSTMDNLNAGIIGALRVPVPPLQVQSGVLDYLDEQTAKIDALIARAERFIEVSKERRSALITAAVTGQIDVRTAASVGA